MTPHALRSFLAGLLFLFAFAPLCMADAITPKHSTKFVRYRNCEFVPTTYADGDSFLVRIREDEFVFRLYYVDAPESDERFPDRNAQQAQYFGITPAESVAAGKAAKEYVRQLLTKKRFTVFTRWATAMGSSKLPRYYAVIEVDGRGLADLLVEHGFARLVGKTVNHPDGTKADAYIASLAELEKSAEAARAGAWTTAKPELRHPVVEAEKEIVESPRWGERSFFAGLGASFIAAAWIVTATVRRRKR